MLVVLNLLRVLGVITRRVVLRGTNDRVRILMLILLNQKQATRNEGES